MDKNRQLRILIVDDDAVVRKGLEAVLQLEDDMKVVGFASNGLEALELAVRLSPDVILMDLSMPHLDGFEAIQLIREKQVDASVIALDVQPDTTCKRRAIKAGASAIIDKSSPDVNVIHVIKSL